jgi:hypothetical protein
MPLQFSGSNIEGHNDSGKVQKSQELGDAHTTVPAVVFLDLNGSSV